MSEAEPTMDGTFSRNQTAFFDRVIPKKKKAICLKCLSVK